jgi:hypothetical protein
MAISSVRAQVNGTWYNLTYNSSTGAYTASIPAPGTTSYNRTGKYYNVVVEATNTAGTKTTVDGSTLTSLQLKVKETVKPVITIKSPAKGAYLTTSTPTITIEVVDESGGSGVNMNSFALKVDSTTVASSAYTKTTITNGVKVTYTPAALADGSHTITVNCSDNDGNAATAATSTFIVDTVPPTLNVTAPVEGTVANVSKVTVSGTTNDATSSNVTVKITVNGTDQGSVTVATNGSFSKEVTLAEGSNTIVVTATDAAGKASSVTRKVSLDTSAPVIQSASVSPNPVNTGATMIITVVVE